MCEERSIKSPLYRSSLTGEPLTLRRARIAIVAGDDIPKKPPFRGTVDRVYSDNPDDRGAIEAINNFYWDSIEQDVFGRTYNIFDCDNFLAHPAQDEYDKADPTCHGIAGHVALAKEKDFLHIVVFHVWPQWHGRGVGRKLLDASIDEARREGFGTIKLGTTNDNIPALYFYQRAGFVIEEVVPGDVESVHGAEMIGFAGIPVRDEFRLRLDL